MFTITQTESQVKVQRGTFNIEVTTELEVISQCEPCVCDPVPVTLQQLGNNTVFHLSSLTALEGHE